MFTVLLAVAIFFAVTTYQHRRAWKVEARRADMIGHLLTIARRDYVVLGNENLLLEQENIRLRQAMRDIQAAITRRPPRRRWLQIARKVAQLAA